MHVNVAIHPSWLGRPEELGRRLAALTLLERTAPPGASPATTTSPIRPTGPASRRKPPYPERPAPAPSRNGREPGQYEGPAGEPADRRAAVARLGRQASPGHEGADHRLGEEEGTALEDRRMDAPAGRGSVPVRPRPAGLYDPLTEPCPPTPRADAFAARPGKPAGARHLNRWTAGQRRTFEKIWWEEVTAAATSQGG